MSQPPADGQPPVTDSPPPATGDPHVDQILADFVAETTAPGATTGTAVGATTQAHRRLQARLSDPP